jgi:hypothetical protein
MSSLWLWLRLTTFCRPAIPFGPGWNCITGLAVLSSWIGHLWLHIASACDIRSTSNMPVCLPTNSRYVDHTAKEVTELNLHPCKMDRKDGLISGRLADCTSTFCFGQSSLTLRTVQFSATSQWKPEVTQSYFPPFQSFCPALNLLIFCHIYISPAFYFHLYSSFYFNIYIYLNL